MFIEVIRGRTSDPAALRAALDRWSTDIRPGAEGFLGATAGVTHDGQFVDVVRWRSADDVRRNDARPEQDAWWRETAQLLDSRSPGVATDDVELDLVGDPDRAGFVQVMQGRATDRQRAKELMSGDSFDWASFRPEILGSVSVDHGDGGWTSVVYFTSEAEAREGERKELPPELQARMAELGSLADGPVEYLDLTDPWLYGPG